MFFESLPIYKRASEGGKMVAMGMMWVPMPAEQLSLVPRGCIMAHTVQQRVLHDTKSITATGRGNTARQGGKMFCSAALPQVCLGTEAMIHKSEHKYVHDFSQTGIGGKTDHILISCDSTILASDFLTRRAVRREAGLCASTQTWALAWPVSTVWRQKTIVLGLHFTQL